MTHRFAAVAVAGAVMWAWFAPQPAKALPCPVLPISAKFASGMKMTVIERGPHKLTYEMTNPDGSFSSRASLHDLFPLSSVVPTASFEFHWSQPIQDLGKLTSGMVISGSAVAQNSDGKRSPFNIKIEVGGSETITVAGCKYDVVKLTTSGSTDTVRYYHEPSMLSLRTILFKRQADGSLKELTEHVIVDLK